MENQHAPDLSIIVPLFNEEESVTPMYRAIADVIDTLALESEIVFVDDGSRDTTFKVAAGIAAEDQRLRVIRFRRNYGQTPAMAAGIDNARGNILITMDGDLQNDPRDIPQFIDELQKGFDIVVGWRHKRKDKWLSRKLPSKIANWLIGKITGVPIKDNGCSLKAYRASVIKHIPLYSEMHRFIPAMASISGARISEIKVRHHERQFGQSKYGLSRIYKVLLDLLTIKLLIAFSNRPMLWFFAAASLAALASTATFTAAFISSFSTPLIVPLVIVSTAVILGALAIFLAINGILAELLVRTGSTTTRPFWALTAQISSQLERPMS